MQLNRKKIGIITFIETRSNYGQVLQAFALQYLLKQWGYDAFVIDYQKRPGRNWLKRLIIVIIEYLGLSSLYFMFQGDKLWKKDRYRHFDAFKKKYISLTDIKYRSLYQLQKNPPKADFYITGSDQVWSQLISDIDNRAYFLDFGNDNVRRISYAPSFAMSVYPQELNSQLGCLLKRLDYISVREDSGVNICMLAGCQNVQKVLDPTLLLKGEDYKNLFLKSKDMTSSFIFVYCLNIENKDEMEWNNVSLYAKKNKLNIVVTPSSGAYPAKELFDNVCYSYCTVDGWISNIFYSTLTITTSFHGVVFCLLLNKNFVYIPLKNRFKRANDRIYELLDALGLKDKIVCSSQYFNHAVNANINWNVVNSKIDEYREISLSFLKNAIKD